jgi:hypothetical protein
MKKKSMKERKSHMTNAISFKARAVYLDEEPRTGVFCNFCRAVDDRELDAPRRRGR